MKTNYHTHTYRCGHALGNDEQFVKAAIDAGFSVLGFSDHLPVPNYTNHNDRMTIDQWDEYISNINTLREKYAGRIEIQVGVEAEWIPHELDYLKAIRAEVDYMILGQHEKFTVDEHYDYTHFCDDDDVMEYAQYCQAGLESGMYRYLAHPDYFMLGRKTFSPACEAAAHQIASVCERLNIPMEINMKGFGAKRNIDGVWQPVYPFRKFWEIVGQYKVKCIFGCDAHRPMDLYRGELIGEILMHLSDIKLEIVDQLNNI